MKALAAVAVLRPLMLRWKLASAPAWMPLMAQRKKVLPLALRAVLLNCVVMLVA
jgi:hypothetical protein